MFITQFIKKVFCCSSSKIIEKGTRNLSPPTEDSPRVIIHDARLLADIHARISV